MSSGKRSATLQPIPLAIRRSISKDGMASVLDLAQHACIDTGPFSHLFLVQAGRLPHLLDVLTELHSLKIFNQWAKVKGRPRGRPWDRAGAAYSLQCPQVEAARLGRHECDIGDRFSAARRPAVSRPLASTMMSDGGLRTL
jgi:hypothetical protein